MQNVKPFSHVFQPLTIRGLTLKNRLQYAPTVVLKCAPNGDMTQEMIDFMKWQANTGVAYITVGDTPVTHENDSAWLCEMNVNSDDCIHGMNQLVESARYNGAEISVELAHAGRGSRQTQGGDPVLAVSASRPLNPEETNLKEMDYDDMQYMKERYVDCAVRCKKAGFRMVMLHCAHNNLIAQFLSPHSNVRTDEYGGSPENRRRWPLEVIKAVREAVGEDMVIEIRVSAQEDTPGGLEFPESLDFMEAAQEFVDIIHISRGNIFTIGGTYTIPTYLKGRQLNVAFAAEAKKRLKIPVAVVGNITSLAEAEEIIASGKADIVAMAKSHMADGDLVAKSLKSNIEDIRPCTRCDWCGNANTYGTSMRCAINPRMGISGEIEKLPETKRKRVVVIGGGPGGMMAAQTLTARGHKVTLFEKSDSLGGLLKDATDAPFKEYLRKYLEWDIRATLNCGADIRLNSEVSLHTIEKENPDAVIVATGSSYLHPQIPGINKPIVKKVREVDNHSVDPGQKVVICGGGLTGLECALMLAMEGKSVTVIDKIPKDNFCEGMPIFNRADLLAHLNKYNVNLIGEVSVTEFTDHGIELQNADGHAQSLVADSCVIAMGVEPDNSLAHLLLKEYGPQVSLVGDCVSRGRTFYHANQEAYHASMKI
ncbi:MAG: FAD-dependent oxidoreductase [Spirochaetales bacterium]|nr:FAD-dependent oxidoreductase [Spirochaetales bacterium]